MQKVIPFPNAAKGEPFAPFRTEPASRTHAVQFYEEDGQLFDSVGRFLAAGLECGDRAVVISTKEHIDGFLAGLEHLDVPRAIAEGRLTILDAEETLATFMVGDMPDRELFFDALSHVVAKVKEHAPEGTRIRAFGEMVDVLWRDGNSKAAIRLEELWNDAIEQHSLSLLCAYVMGNFYREGDAARFMQVCGTHDLVLPAEAAPAGERDSDLREISFLQQRTRALENEVAHRKDLEIALRDALRTRTEVEEELRQSVERERAARVQAEANDAFKEVFLGILGHDLRNPLNTVLTTARLMTMRRELPPESQKRLDRVVSSGERMQRMIEQLLDVARARLADGIPVECAPAQDIGPLVAKIVEETRAAHPGRTIDLQLSPCVARLDPDRFEQVVSNLLGNAVTHGDASKPIRVDVAVRDAHASVSVHNHGKPIDPALLPRLFDPFSRAASGHGRTAGLGLGLYIAERIMTAHGGRIEVESTESGGTKLEAFFPRG